MTTFNWVEDYVVSRKVLGWSEEEFWNATPRKFWASYFTYLDFKNCINQSANSPKPLTGKDAIASLSSLAKSVR